MGANKKLYQNCAEQEQDDGDGLKRWPNDGTGKEIIGSLMQRYSDNSVFLRVNKINDNKTIQQ